MTRLHERRIHTQYFREYYVPFQMSPDRMQDLDRQIEPKAATPINRDFSPIAYYFDVALWSSRFHSRWRDLLEWLAALRFGAAAVAAFLGLLILTVASGLCERLGVARHGGSGDGSRLVIVMEEDCRTPIAPRWGSRWRRWGSRCLASKFSSCSGFKPSTDTFTNNWPFW